MRSVYAHASRGLIWMGGSDADVDEAIDAFSHPDFDSRDFPIGTAIEPLYHVSSALRERRYDFGSHKGEDRLGGEDITHSRVTSQEKGSLSFTSRAIKDIISRQWWTWVRVVQEFIVARTLPLACIGRR